MYLRRTQLILFVALALASVASAASSQDSTASAGGEVAARPFLVGERLSYSVRVGPIGKGSAVTEIVKVDTVRGRRVYHSTFTVRGSLLFFKVDDLYQSWFDPRTFESLRYHQRIDQGTYERDRKYEIYPDRGVFVETGKPEQQTVEQPLDDAAFLYFMRTIPLEVGRTYSFNRYFKPDRNPVSVTVVRRERIRLPAGEFDAFVLHPKIKARGIFAENARAEVWIQDDESRTLLQMRTRMPFGAVTFQLRSRENVRGNLATK